MSSLNTYEATTLVIRVSAIVVTVLVAILALFSWRRQQRLLRKSSAAQRALSAQVAFRLKVALSHEHLKSAVLLATPESEQRTREVVESYQADIEDRFIRLIEALTLCEKTCSGEASVLASKYLEIYDELCLNVSGLVAKINGTDYSDDETSEFFEDCLSRMQEIESDNVIGKHIL